MSLPKLTSMLSLFGLSVTLLAVPTRVLASDPAQHPAAVQITIPDEDRFSPFAMTVHVGTTVTWVNNDTDDHTLVSDDAFNTAGHFGTNVVIKAERRQSFIDLQASRRLPVLLPVSRDAR